MTSPFSPSTAYHQLHHALLEQRSRARSAEAIRSVNRALLGGENLSAAFWDLSVLKQLQQRKTQPLLTEAAQREVSGFLSELTPLLPVSCDSEAQFDRLQQQIQQLSAHFAWQHASLLLAQHALFSHTYHRWHQVLEALFRLNDGEAARAQIALVLRESGSRVTVLGETRELYRALALLSAQQTASGPHDPADPLTDYISAADIATRGIITFGTTAEAVLRGRPLPDARMLSARIRQHHDSVIERTHPWFNCA